MYWKPIETHPTDGTEFWVNDAEEFYYDGGPASMGTFGRPVKLYSDKGIFKSRECSSCWYEGNVMTHWKAVLES